MTTPHAMLRMLEAQGRETEYKIGHRPIGAAACAVLDELIRRTRVLADAVPADVPLTLSLIDGYVGDVADALEVISTMLTSIVDLATEGADAVDARRQPFLRFVARVEPEGFAVVDTLTEVIDTTDWSTLESSGDAGVQVQLAAEKIARAEQAVIYQQRIERMAAEIGQTEHGYAQRIRDLIDTLGR